MRIELFLIAIAAAFAPLTHAAAQTAEEPKNEDNAIFNADFDNEPTYIKADTLTLRSKDRTFVYSGNVEVRQGDMLLTSAQLDGKYNEDNEIQQLIAKQNVVITKGPKIRATSEKAVYEAATETVTLTENPELVQEESVLTADAVRIFLREDRSQAEGQVRVKLVDKGGGKGAGLENIKDRSK